MGLPNPTMPLKQARIKSLEHLKKDRSVALDLADPFDSNNLQDSSTSAVDRSGKAAPLPPGIDEMKDEIKSGAGSQNLPGGGKDVEGKGDVEPKV